MKYTIFVLLHRKCAISSLLSIGNTLHGQLKDKVIIKEHIKPLYNVSIYIHTYDTYIHTHVSAFNFKQVEDRRQEPFNCPTFKQIAYP